jgi:hypothetical protein
MGCIDNSSNCGCHLSGGNCISITGDGSAGNPYVIAPIIDPSPSNALTCGASGLLAPSAVAPGLTMMYPSNTPPAGWLACLGQAVSRTTFAALNALAAAASYSGLWGPGDHLTTFNLPNMQGMFPAGVSGTDVTFSLGATGGEKTHVLIEAEIPPHTHDLQHGINDANIQSSPGPYSIGAYPGGWVFGPNGGGGGAHNTLPPYQTWCFVIKT